MPTHDGVRLRAAILVCVCLCAVAGCAPDTELTGVVSPNIAPTTDITGFPPTIYEASYTVAFRWTGFDHDGRIVGFQWRLSDNGTDGLSYRDTLTVDPVTGEVLNPWHFTTATDTTFLVTADLENYPNDDPSYQRNYQTHTFFIRAVDDDGAWDNSPETVSFTSTTLMPRIRVSAPATLVGQNDAEGVPRNVTIGWVGEDFDSESGRPAEVRYLWKEAIGPDGEYISSRVAYNAAIEELVDFADSNWSPWQPYGENAAQRRASFPGQSTELHKRFLFAIQARDEAGAISYDRDYGYSVVNTKIVQNKAPRLDIYEASIGSWSTYYTNQSVQYDIASGQEVSFSWSASAEAYAGTIVSYRWGWNVTDPDDLTDPNWAVGSGLGPIHVQTGPRSFSANTHTLTIQTTDDSGQVSRCKVILSIVPTPPIEMQRPLLLVDDYDDHNSGRWCGEYGIPQDTDEKRDLFWQRVLSNVNGFHAAGDVYDTYESSFTYRELVNYRVVVWVSKYIVSPYNLIAREFRDSATCNGDMLNWLATYQKTAGNLLLVSSRALNQFLREYYFQLMLPIFFDVLEDRVRIGDFQFTVSFGTCTGSDGNNHLYGLKLYPYSIAGVSMIDIVSPIYHLYGRTRAGRVDRSPICVGAKGVVLDREFAANHFAGSAAFDDTIMTDTTIDWRDRTQSGGIPYYDNLTNPWDFGDTEFYEADVVGRPTYVYPQMCVDQLCVEPMFRIYSRFDWIKQNHLLAGDTDWPESQYDDESLASLCGDLALENYSARTNDQICGFVSHKTKAFKPSQKGDVYWGFDPYRFNATEMGKAVHWILGEHFGLTVW